MKINFICTMKTLKNIALIGILVVLFSACGSTPEADPNLIVVKGILKEQGITTYQYGTHTISGDDAFFALSSGEVDLAPYVGKQVEIRATRIAGYPVDGGPVYLQVKKVNEL